MISADYLPTRDYLNTVPNQTTEAEWQRLSAEAKTFPVKRLPYSGERATLKFDRRTRATFKRRPMNTPSAIGNAKLDFNDFQNGMHMRFRATAYEMRLYYTPVFASNDDLLRLVLAQQAYDYIISSMPFIVAFYETERVPEGFVRNRESLEALCRKATDAHKEFRMTIENMRHIMWAEAHGGYLALRTTIAYRAWREAKDAHAIADELGISHVAVRQILSRLCMTGRYLGLETFPLHHSALEGRKFESYETKVVRKRTQEDYLQSFKTRIRKLKRAGRLTIQHLETLADMEARIKPAA